MTGQGEDWVELDGRVRFASKLVRENLEGIHKIIPYVCTCGLEAQAWSEQFQDPLEEFWAEELKIKVLGPHQRIAAPQNKGHLFSQRQNGVNEPWFSETVAPYRTGGAVFPFGYSDRTAGGNAYRQLFDAAP